MSHEPECPEFEYDRPPLKANCVCANICAAYQRGREDAERDVFAAEALPFSNLLPHGVAAAAARGDGERA